MDNPLSRNDLSNKKPSQLPTNKRRPRSADLRRLSHELVNCLTVINLSCFKMRGIPAIASEPAILSQLETIEKTVADAADLLVKLPDDEANSKSSPSHRRVGGKVYPLFRPIRKEP